MSKLRARLRLLRRDADGSAAVEFGLIGPLFLAMFLGVLQLGVAMQSFNAMRSISADVARYAAITYQKGTKPTDSDIELYTTAIAEEPPYGLTPSKLVVDAATVSSPQFTGAKEITLTITYTVPSFLAFFGVNDFPMSYSRPIFVMP